MPHSPKADCGALLFSPTGGWGQLTCVISNGTYTVLLMGTHNTLLRELSQKKAISSSSGGIFFTPSVNGGEVPLPSGDSMPTCTVRTHLALTEKSRSARNIVSVLRGYTVARFSSRERTRGFSSSPSTAGFTSLSTVLSITTNRI